MTLARNGALAAVAAFVVWQGRDGAGPGALGWMGELTAAQLVALILGLVGLALLAGQWGSSCTCSGRMGVSRCAWRLSRRTSVRAMRWCRPQTGRGRRQGFRSAPRRLLSPWRASTGETPPSIPALFGQAVLLLFTDPGCGPCTAMLPEIGRWQEGTQIS